MLLFSTVLDIDKSMTKDAFIRLIIEWNQGSPHPDNVIRNMNWNGEWNIRFGDDGLWLDIEEYRNKNIIAVRYEKRENDGVVWDTDYVMNFDCMKMSVRLDRSYTEEALDTNPRFSTPYFITLLIERGYLKDDHGLPIQRNATVINENNVQLLVDVINKKTYYNLPVVYVSKTYDDHDPVNVSYLAKRLKGVAHVMVEDGNWLNTTINRRCRRENELYGAIGIYYPKRGMTRKRFLYRSSEGYDDYLRERVISAVIQYSNAQLVDTLFTWQGVNNALLRDRLSSQRTERLTAEAARRAAEDKLMNLLDSLNEEELKIRKQAIEDANKILESFDDENSELQRQVEELTRANESLQVENQGLKTKLDSRESIPLLFMGDEVDFYPGEVKDLVLETLSEAMTEMNTKSRRADVVRDIVRNNGYQKLSVSKAVKIKKLLKDYGGMSSKTRQELKDLGFTVTDAGKHYKVTYFGDKRYTTSYSKTPSDGRTGKNTAQQTITMAF